MVAVVRKNVECIGDAIREEFDRCINQSKLPSNSTSEQHCQYVLFAFSVCTLLCLYLITGVTEPTYKGNVSRFLRSRLMSELERMSELSFSEFWPRHRGNFGLVVDGLISTSNVRPLL